MRRQKLEVSTIWWLLFILFFFLKPVLSKFFICHSSKYFQPTNNCNNAWIHCNGWLHMGFYIRSIQPKHPPLCWQLDGSPGAQTLSGLQPVSMYGAAVSLVDALSSLWDIKLSAEVCRTSHVTMPARELETTLTLHGAEITSNLCFSLLCAVCVDLHQPENHFYFIF